MVEGPSTHAESPDVRCRHFRDFLNSDDLLSLKQLLEGSAKGLSWNDYNQIFALTQYLLELGWRQDNCNSKKRFSDFFKKYMEYKDSKLNNADAFNKALQEIYGINLKELEEQWKKYNEESIKGCNVCTCLKESEVMSLDIFSYNLNIGEFFSTNLN